MMSCRDGYLGVHDYVLDACHVCCLDHANSALPASPKQRRAIHMKGGGSPAGDYIRPFIFRRQESCWEGLGFKVHVTFYYCSRSRLCRMMTVVAVTPGNAVALQTKE